MASVFKRGGKRAKGSWYASWFDHNGKRHTKSTRTTDKATAERIAKKHEADASLRREGVIDPALATVNSEAKRSIKEHLSNYEYKMRAADCTDNHVSRTAGMIRKIAKWAEFTTVSNITADGVNRYAAKMHDAGLSPRTIQAYLTAIKGFTRWLTNHHKLPRDPLSSVKKPNPESDRRHIRRMLLPEEWYRISSATLDGPRHHGMISFERELLYRTAIHTGLRSSELRSLTQGQLHLDDQQPFVTCKARATKNRKNAQQFIPDDLAVDLKIHITAKSPKNPVFNLPHETDLAEMLRIDLAAARKEWLCEANDNPDVYSERESSDFLLPKSHNGAVMDFHCLRHTCGAWLAITGAQPKVVQQVMRHASIVQTMDTYGHLFPGQEAAAINRMNDLLNGHFETQRAVPAFDLSTGRENSAQRHAQQLQRDSLQTATIGCDGEAPEVAQLELPKLLRVASLGDCLRLAAKRNKSRPGRIRTSDQGIMSPLL